MNYLARGKGKGSDHEPLDSLPLPSRWVTYPSTCTPGRISEEQGCHGTGKTGNLKVHFSRQGKHREFAKKY